jgi:hypothetical protein
MKTDTIEWCPIASSASPRITNPLMKIVLDNLKKVAPSLIKPCPIEGHQEVSFKMGRAIIYIMPPGSYLFKLSVFNDDDPVILQMAVANEISS